MVASQDTSAWQDDRPIHRALTFDGLLSNTQFVADMRTMLKTLEDAYRSPVDIEFTVNFTTIRVPKST
jgi:hypothetical protein